MGELQRSASLALQSVVVETVATPEQLRERIGRAHAASILKLGRRLVELGLITQEQLEHGLRVQSSHSNLRLGQVLIELGLISDAHLAQVVCDQLDIPLVDLEKFPIERAVVPLVPATWARRYNMLPLCRIDGHLCLAMSDPLDTRAMEHARFCAQMSVLPVMALRDDIYKAVANIYFSDRIPYVNSRTPVPLPAAPAIHRRMAESAPAGSTQPERATLDASLRVQSRARTRPQPALLSNVVETVASSHELRTRLERVREGATKKLGARLLELALLTPEQLNCALDMQRANPRLHLGQALLQRGFVSEVHLKQLVCDELGIPLVDLDRFAIDRAVLQLIPERSARPHRMLPLCRIEGQLFVAMADPLDAEARQHAQFCAQIPVAPVMAIRHQVERAIATLYDTRVRVMPGAMRREQSRHWDINAALAWC